MHFYTNFRFQEQEEREKAFPGGFPGMGGMPGGMGGMPGGMGGMPGGMGGMPGGMGGMGGAGGAAGGMPDLGGLFSDPDIMAAFQVSERESCVT